MAARTIATRYFPYRVTVPAGTTIVAPQTTALVIDWGTLLAFDIQIPSGHVGLTGFSLFLARTRIFPWGESAAFLVGDDYRETFPVDVEVDRNQLQAVCYNTGVFDHSFYFRIALRYIEPRASAAVPVGAMTAPVLVASGSSSAAPARIRPPAEPATPGMSFLYYDTASDLTYLYDEITGSIVHHAGRPVA